MSPRKDSRRYLLWLSLVTAVMACAMAALLVLQINQGAAIRKSQAEQVDALSYVAFQLDREYLRLRHMLDVAVNGKAAPDLDNLVLRYDIFVSRIALVRDGPTGGLMHDLPIYDKAMEQLNSFVRLADPIFAKSPLQISDLRSLQEPLNSMGVDVQELAAKASNLVSNQLTAQNGALLAQSNKVIALTLAQLMMLLGAAAAIFVRHKRQEQERLALEKLTHELREANVLAESANRSKSQFLSNMSHELRTPFNGMLGMLGLLEETPLSSQQADYIKVAQSSGEHLLSVLNDILDVSALEAGKMAISPAAVCLPQLLDEVDALMQTQAHAKKLQFHVTRPESMPQWVNTDSKRVKQILFNLINNAIKFTERGSITLAVSSAPSTNRPGQFDFSCAVTDTGIGMSAQGLNKLFQRFQQIDDNANRKYSGSGLGLEISRTLARNMGGDITVTSTVGQGSTFTLTLPLVSIAAPATERQAPAVPAAQSAQTKPPAPAAALTPPASSTLVQTLDSQQPRVLVVEDHPVNQKLMGALLKRFNCNATFCDDGQQSLEKMEGADFDLVLMDINMPVMDGLTATRGIRAMPSPKGQVPIIVMTADVMNEARQQSLDAGATDFLSKPVNAALFRETMQKYITLPN
ncbi:ATP-binding protein [Rhodoferax aquaticus]|uniref:Virulence sensor protein BvgS n=1 Tax=Rhodoferax aquaticus TaxID=2527691 RepID=A0A515EMI6_9BURK|nr:ATP-binding protein [Rhodoferax aquaticus]QDL53868.1 response regulator [Rhodoferax aquaticus]